jgi:hypothetical protein
MTARVRVHDLYLSALDAEPLQPSNRQRVADAAMALKRLLSHMADVEGVEGNERHHSRSRPIC